MPLTNAEKNLIISALENSLEDAQTGADVESLAEIETAVSDLRDAYDEDPDTVTASALIAAVDKILGCRFGSLTSISGVIAAARQEAGS